LEEPSYALLKHDSCYAQEGLHHRADSLFSYVGQKIDLPEAISCFGVDLHHHIEEVTIETYASTSLFIFHFELFL